MGWFYRTPRIRQERRVNGSREYRRIEVLVGGELHEFRVRIRGKRSVRMLPEEWDDQPRTRQRTWKEHRHTQYKVRPVGG